MGCARRVGRVGWGRGRAWAGSRAGAVGRTPHSRQIRRTGRVRAACRRAARRREQIDLAAMSRLDALPPDRVYCGARAQTAESAPAGNGAPRKRGTACRRPRRVL